MNQNIEEEEIEIEEGEIEFVEVGIGQFFGWGGMLFIRITLSAFSPNLSANWAVVLDGDDSYCKEGVIVNFLDTSLVTLILNPYNN